LDLVSGRRPSYPARTFTIEVEMFVDKRAFGWIKVDGQVMQSFSMGLFVARVQRGSHIRLVPVTRSGCRNASKYGQAPEFSS
jgi:hypothetical protein